MLQDAGEAAAISFLKTITSDKRLIEAVGTLVKYHMYPLSLYNSQAKAGAVRRLANKCDIQELLLLYEADRKRGEMSGDESRDPVTDWFQGMIESYSLDKKAEPLVNGRDLIALGLEPGPQFAKILDEAFEMQMDGCTYEEIMEMIKYILNENKQG